MKAKKLLFFVMAICLASGVRAQFYDGPDDIYYYVQEYNEYEDYYWETNMFGQPIRPHYTGEIKKKQIEKNDAKVLIFNFDGMKAAELTNTLEGRAFGEVKSTIAKNPSYYEDKIETTEYNIKYYSSSSSETIYNYKTSWATIYSYKFSVSKNTLKCVTSNDHPVTFIYKRVDKNYFKVGRSRTPSGTMYE